MNEVSRRAAIAAVGGLSVSFLGSLAIADSRQPGKTIMDDGQAHPNHPGHGYEPLLQFEQITCGSRGVVLHIKSDNAEELTIVLNGVLLSWELRKPVAEGKLEYDTNLTDHLGRGLNVLVVTATNTKDHIDLDGHLDVGDKRYNLDVIKKDRRRAGVFYQGTFLLTK
jgi:hypothetical protein